MLLNSGILAMAYNSCIQHAVQIKLHDSLLFSGVPHTHHSPDVSIEDHMYGM